MTQLDEDRTPHLLRDAFDCPSCQAYARQIWGDAYMHTNRSLPLTDWRIATCTRCDNITIWHNRELIFPLSMVGPLPHADMPPEVRDLYEEARTVSSLSRKSAAALLRLALQVLVDGLEPGSANINSKIGALVQRGLHPQVQQAMDVLRVVGNNAVHPGQIDLDADDDLLPALFVMLNLIVEQVVARPKHVAGLFASLPATAQAAVAKRDGQPSP